MPFAGRSNALEVDVQATLDDAIAFVRLEIVRRERVLRAGAARNPERYRRDLACLTLIRGELRAANCGVDELASILVAQIRRQEKGPSGKLWFGLSRQAARALMVRALEAYARRTSPARRAETASSDKRQRSSPEL